MFQRVEDLFCQTVRDARYFSNFLDAGLLAAPCSPPIYFSSIWRRFGPTPSIVSSELVLFTFARFFTMSGNRMIVRFIADVLDYVQSGRIRRQAKPLAFRFKE